MGIIISSFIGCGRTYLTQLYGDKVKIKFWYPTEETPSDYAQEISDLTNDYDIVFVPSDKEIRESLEDSNIDYDLYYPSSDRRIEFVENQVRKHSTPKIIQALDQNFKTWVEEIDNDESENCHLHKLSDKGQFLTHDSLIMQYIDSIKSK